MTRQTLVLFFKIHTFKGLLKTHVSSELGAVSIIEIQDYSNLTKGWNDDNVMVVSCMCTQTCSR